MESLCKAQRVRTQTRERSISERIVNRSLWTSKLISLLRRNKNLRTVGSPHKSTRLLRCQNLEFSIFRLLGRQMYHQMKLTDRKSPQVTIHKRNIRKYLRSNISWTLLEVIFKSTICWEMFLETNELLLKMQYLGSRIS